MPRRDINLQKKPVKCLQGGPRLTKIMKDRRRDTAYVMERLISRILEEDDVKLVMEDLKKSSIKEASKNMAVHQLQKNIQIQPTNSRESGEDPAKLEDCMEMLEGLKVVEEKESKEEEADAEEDWRISLAKRKKKKL